MHRDITLESADHTSQFARALAAEAQVGDVILLEGDLGAGKTHFGRSMIQSLLQQPEDVPSPTFTLVQTYHAADFDIWHADLYRLSSLYEIEELGLVEAFETALCLVEWPDRLGDARPQSALTLHFQHRKAETERGMRASWTDDKWTRRKAISAL